MTTNGQKSAEDLRQELIGKLLDKADRYYEEADLFVQAARELQRLNNRLASLEADERLDDRFRRTQSIREARIGG